MDIELDVDTHDIVIRQYDIALIEQANLVRQRIKQRLWFFLGEWYLAIDEGVPYFQEILKKAPDRARVESIFKNTIALTPGVLELTAFEMEYEADIRRLNVTFSAQTDEGIIENMEVQI